MEKITLNIAELARIVGATPKTIYRLIERKELMTVKEKVNGREITRVVTDENQIESLKNTYNKMSVNDRQKQEKDSQCNDILTDNDSQDNDKVLNFNTFAEQLMTANRQLQDRLFTVTDQLMSVKGQMPLLEDKASREGLYLQEIKDLKANNNAEIDNLKRSHYRLKAWLITVIILLSLALMGVTGFLIYKLANPTIIEKTNTIETIKEVKVPVPAAKRKK